MPAKRALVISGGGAKGAWGVGVAKALVQDKAMEYSTVIGTSTGSLMGPLILGNRFDQLVSAYTSVTQNDIFNVNPFNSAGGIKTVATAWRLIRGKKTIGETENLKQLIRQFLDVSLYNELRNSDKTFGATVTGLKSAQSVVKVLKEETYNDIIDWIWASANQPIFMSLLQKDGDGWVDGGLKDFVTISYVLDNNLADDIDVIIHNTPAMIDQNFDPSSGVFDVLLRTIGIFSADVAQNDIGNARLRSQIDHDINLNLYYMKKEQVDLIGNSLVFDKAKMTSILNQGFDSVVNDSCTMEKCVIKTDGTIHPV